MLQSANGLQLCIYSKTEQAKATDKQDNWENVWGRRDSFDDDDPDKSSGLVSGSICSGIACAMVNVAVASAMLWPSASAIFCLATGARCSEAEKLKPTGLRNGMTTLQRNQERQGSFGADHCRAGSQDRQALEEARPAKLGYHLVPPRPGQDDHPPAEKGQAAHALRHTFASHFIQNGGNILTLQKILGHPSLAMTMRTWRRSIWRRQ